MRAKKDPTKAVAETMGNVQNETVMGPLEAIEAEQQQKVYEIVPGMTAEEMTAMFFDDTALIEPPYKVWQLNSNGHRYYYRFNEKNEPEFYPSVTTILSQTLPQSPFLVKWIADKGIEEAERYKQERAAYGTFMHAQFENLIISRRYDLDDMKNKLKDYIEYQGLPGNFISYADDLKKDVLAFAQFVLDYDVKPIAVEIALVHPDYKYAGMIDLPCRMKSSPKSDEYINAIVDFKSGRKGFYEDHEIQLHLYKMMWNVNFPEMQIDRVFNFSPKDWRKKPGYNLKDQTDSPNAAKIPALLDIAAIEDNKRDNIFTSVSGDIDLDGKPNLTDNVITLTLSELIQTRGPKEETPEESEDITAEDINNAGNEEAETTTEQKTANDTAKVANLDVKPVKRTITPKKENNVVNGVKNEITDLLNQEPEI